MIFRNANFESHTEIEEFFSQYFQGGVSTLKDVEEFLQENKINHSKILVGDYPHLSSVVDFRQQSHIHEYDTSIVFKIPRDALKPPDWRQRLRYWTLRDFSIWYSVYFLFKNSVLVQIYVDGQYIAL